MGFSLTQFSLQSVVSFGSSCCGGAPAAMKPVNFTKAVVPTALAFKGTHPCHGARAVHEDHIVNGHAAIKTRANRFKHQLEGGQRSERESRTDRRMMVKFLTTTRLSLSKNICLKLQWYFVLPQGGRNSQKSQTILLNPLSLYLPPHHWKMHEALGHCLVISGWLQSFHTWKFVSWCGTGQCASCHMLPWAPLRVQRRLS